MELSKLEKITLQNRDGADLYLLQIEPNSNMFRIVCDKDHKYVLDFARIILCEDNKSIYAVDPSGGPFLSIGYKLKDDKSIRSIFIAGTSILFIVE